LKDFTARRRAHGNEGHGAGGSGKLKRLYFSSPADINDISENTHFALMIMPMGKMSPNFKRESLL
jgi:hypothetical protein